MVKGCEHSSINIEELCNCSYQGCDRKGICCECLHYHRKNKQLPACFFDDDAEKTYDRSVRKYVKEYLD
ncbi:MAG: cytosolic protein [Candidatus Syntrophonatronum acetioxidans]|uniref:Cytosolic protein n=1 Tax=Candidatus Syntrophonatronum acetioxidans TaxID=1795816 RepID=A0A424YJ82_9FIRM|nr:MAG: cytosolic protein [Candidatus Syntrophonatronum acetioxidans]